MKFQVGDRVKGRYNDTIYTGVVERFTTEETVVVLRDDTEMEWSCFVRGNGEVAGAWGCDDGIHNLELLTKNKTMENYINLGDQKIEISQETADNLREMFGKE